MIDRRIFLATCALLGAATALPAQTMVPEKTVLETPVVEVPMDATGQRLMVDVMIGDQGPFRFGVDTGGMGMARVDSSLVERLGLEKIGEVRASDGSGRGTRTLPRFSLGTVRVGGAVFHGVEAISRDYNASLPPGVARIDGILGYHLFHDVLLTLDAPGGRLRLERGALPPADGEEILDLVADARVAAIELPLGKKPILTHLDTGNTRGMVVPASLAAELPLASAPVVVGKARTVTNEFDISRATLDGSVSIGRHRLERPSLSFAEIFDTANLGFDILSQFALTFDQANQRVRFARDGESPIAEPERYRIGVGFSPASDALEVSLLVPGGAGEAAGLRKGDRVVAVGGRPVAEVPQSELGILFGRPEPVELEVRRGEETLSVTLTPRRDT